MKKKKLSEEFPCKCGHKKKSHIMLPFVLGGDIWCLERNGKDNFEECDCNKYSPDNLKYLEQKEREGKKNDYS
jgi:hypothetical protein